MKRAANYLIFILFGILTQIGFDLLVAQPSSWIHYVLTASFFLFYRFLIEWNISLFEGDAKQAIRRTITGGTMNDRFSFAVLTGFFVAIINREIPFSSAFLAAFIIASLLAVSWEICRTILISYSNFFSYYPKFCEGNNNCHQKKGGAQNGECR